MAWGRSIVLGVGIELLRIELIVEFKYYPLLYTSGEEGMQRATRGEKST